ncbi:MAG: hypothetical protein BWK76_03310 [Desulfobulbaceae bacterium A2]|nr:MAG: hypothetical protein BWK76_03310 [Desulfobulbaceae bacterium A2]
MRYLYLYLVLIVLLVASGALGGDLPRLTVATADGVPLSTPEGTGFHDQVVREACQRIGVQLDIIHLPAERALLNANDGFEEGVYVRVEGMEASYPNLRMVPEKIGDYEFVAFGKQSSAQLNGWDSLRDYHVAIITGWKILERNIVASKSLTKVKDASLLFRALVDDKVDLVVYNRLDGYGTIKELGLQGIHALDPPFATREMFLYVHKSREALVPQLAAALRAMKDDGSYAAIRMRTLAPYLPAQTAEP